MEGDATAMYIQQQINLPGVKITRLARGLPIGEIWNMLTRLPC